MKMFETLKKIFMNKTFSTEIMNNFLTMISQSEEMLKYAFKKLTINGKTGKFQKKIYFKDQNINLTEREIRKRILIHLAANPDIDLPYCLILMSISKDAERLGDYAKNIFELKQLLDNSDEDRELFQKHFNVIGNELLNLFQTVSMAFKDSERSLATQSIDTGHSISVRCEEIINEIVESDYTTKQAVALAFAARFIKRIALHLSNIASSVVNPLPEMDFVEAKSD